MLLYERLLMAVLSEYQLLHEKSIDVQAVDCSSGVMTQKIGLIIFLFV